MRLHSFNSKSVLVHCSQLTDSGNMTDSRPDVLNRLKINPKECETKLIQMLYELVQQADTLTSNDEHSVGQQLYAATGIQTISMILNERGQSNAQNVKVLMEKATNDGKNFNNFNDIVSEPLTWVSVNVLAAVNGEQHLDRVYAVYKTLNVDKLLFDKLIDKLMTALAKSATLTSIAEHNADFRVNANASLFLIKLLHGVPVSKRASAIDRVVRLRSADITLPDLLSIFTVRPSQFGFETSSHIYVAFVAVMKERRLDDPFLRTFWTQMQSHICCGSDAIVATFYRCCRLATFYDRLCQQIIDFLAQLRCVDMPDFDKDYVGLDGGVFEAVSFRTVSMTVCLLVANASPVRHEFEKLIDSHGLCDTLKSDLFRHMVYD